MNRNRQKTHSLALLALALAFMVGLSAQISQPALGATSVFINELHYDNSGSDAGEAVEIAGPAGTDLAGWSIALYNGNGGAAYNTINLSGVIPNQAAGCGTVSFAQAGIQNGSPDGLALVDATNNVVQFLSYEGSFTAVGGVADGMTSVDIGVAEASSTPSGQSLQLTGSGSMYEDFTWVGPAADSFALPNTGQTFVDCAGASSTDPSGVGAASPSTVASGDLVLLTVTVAPGTGPASTGLTVTGDLTAIGGAAAQAFSDDGTNGDEVAGDNVFSFATAASGAGAVSLPVTVADAEGRNTNTSISLTVIQALTIMEIQGNGQFSPVVGDIVQTSGIVTLITANGSDAWIQDPNGDGDPATSDGIFIDDFNGFAQVGDLITITGQVEEQQFAPQLPRTRIDDTVLVEIVSSGNPLPAPVKLIDLPNESIAEGIAFWEPLEGMLVSTKNTRVVAPTTRFGEFAMLTKKDAKKGSGYFNGPSQILLRDLGGGNVDYNPERILVDDASLASPIVVQPGAHISELEGVVDYTFGNYKLQPSYVGEIGNIAFPEGGVSKPENNRENISIITTYNVENLFDLVDNPDKADEGSTPTPEALETQLTKLAESIAFMLVQPDIVVVQEVENTEILQELANRVNALVGTDYSAVSFETSDARGIEVGFLWDGNRVDLIDAFQLSGPDVEAAFGPNSASPGREPLVGIFDVAGDINQPLYIVGNHFKSKGGDDPPFGINDPFIRITEVQRKMQAQAVRNYVNSILDVDPNAWVMVTGDLNDFAFSEPSEGPDNPVAILEGSGGEVPLTNLIDFIKEKDRYTFIFDGNSQVLDHMLVSPALLELKKGQDILHFNASVAAAVGADPTNAFRAADHDPLEGRFKIKDAKTKFSLTVLHNNDGESQLINAGSGIEDFGGVARFATLVDELRHDADHAPGKSASLLLSSGDNFLAGPEFKASQEKGVPFFDSTAIKLIGYDAMAIGNHEFDFGPDTLADFIEGIDGQLPFVSANLDFSGEPRLQALVDQGIIVNSLVVTKKNQTNWDCWRDHASTALYFQPAKRGR